MKRFFCPARDITKEKIVIHNKDEFHHIVRVARLNIGDIIIVFDGENNEYEVRISEIAPDKLSADIISSCFKKNITDLEIAIACAIPKNKTFSYIIEKLTEIGINTILPVISSRTIPRINREKEPLKLSRWRSIALNASKQSKRNKLPKIEDILDFSQALDYSKRFDLRLMATLHDIDNQFLLKVISSRPYKNVIIFIGPEGDFTVDEAGKAKEAGFISVNLGDNILKVETACIFAASLITAYAKS